MPPPMQESGGCSGSMQRSRRRLHGCISTFRTSHQARTAACRPRMHSPYGCWPCNACFACLGYNRLDWRQCTCCALKSRHTWCDKLYLQNL